MKYTKITTSNFKKAAGVYIIRNLNNDKVYVGQAKSIYNRLVCHKSLLVRGMHENSHLQRSWNKHGPDAFDFSVAEYCDAELLTEKECQHIVSQKKVYNIKEAADHPGGSKQRKHSEETRKLISETAKKRGAPSNLKQIQKENRRPVCYYLNNELIKVFNSCLEAATYFNISPNAFVNYIGKGDHYRKKYGYIRKSKYFGNDYKFEYGNKKM